MMLRSAFVFALVSLVSPFPHGKFPSSATGTDRALHPLFGPQTETALTVDTRAPASNLVAGSSSSSPRGAIALGLLGKSVGGGGSGRSPRRDSAHSPSKLSYPTYAEFLELKSSASTSTSTSTSASTSTSTSASTSTSTSTSSSESAGERESSSRGALTTSSSSSSGQVAGTKNKYALLATAVKEQNALKAQAKAKTNAKAKVKSKGILDTAKQAAGIAFFLKEHLMGTKKGPTPGDVDDCTACRFVWLQVEMDVGESKQEEHIYDSFTRRCIEAQKSAIFQPACDDMFQSIDDMISDYVQDFTVNQMCEASRICR